MTQARNTQSFLEVLSGSDNSAALNTQSFLEVLSGSDNSAARNTQSFLEVLRSVTEIPTEDCDLSASDFDNLVPQYDWQHHFNRAQVEYIGRAEGPRSVVYSTQETLVVHPGQTTTYFARLDQPMVSIDTPTSGSDYFARSAGGLDTSASLTLTSSTCAQKVKLSFENTGSVFTTYISSLRLTGVPAVGQHAGLTSASSASSITRFGEQTLEFPTNPYIQERITAQYLSDFMVDRMEEPRKVYFASNIPGSTIAWPGTKLKICEEDRTSTTACGFIVQTDWEVGPGFVEDITVITSDIFPFSASAYYKLDESSWSTGVRIFY